MKRTRRLFFTSLSAAVTAGVVAASVTAAASPRPNAHTTARPASCVKQTGPATTPADPAPTSVSTVQQAYYCIIDNYYGSARLDTRMLLRSAFRSVVAELVKQGIDAPDWA